MRSLVLLISLICVPALANDKASLEERRQRIIAASIETAAGMNGIEEYVPYLPPFPNGLLKGEELTDFVLFAEGWSNMEPWGIWSEGTDSRFYLRIDPARQPEMLYLHGRYYGEEEATKLFVNGKKLSEVPLIHQKIRLPEEVRNSAQLEIELRHINPSSIPIKAEPGKRAGTRDVTFFLVGIEVW